MMIEKRTHTQLDSWTWEVPTDTPGEQFYLGVLLLGTNLIVVQAMCTFSSTIRREGDYACYLADSIFPGFPPEATVGRYERAAWTAEHGKKLSLPDSLAYGARPLAPNGIRMKWRA
jgi:hypothetical protein